MAEEEQLLKFKLPEVGSIDVYLVRDNEGRIRARTEDELESIIPPNKTPVEEIKS